MDGKSPGIGMSGNKYEKKSKTESKCPRIVKYFRCVRVHPKDHLFYNYQCILVILSVSLYCHGLLCFLGFISPQQNTTLSLEAENSVHQKQLNVLSVELFKLHFFSFVQYPICTYNY